MSDKMKDQSILMVAAAKGRCPRRLSRAARLGMIMGVLGQTATGLAGPPDGTSGQGGLRFEPLPAPPPVLAGRLQGALSAIHVAGAPQGTLYAATDQAGKARAWLLRDNVVLADLTAPASRERMSVDWAGTFAFWLGGLPVVAISWKSGHGAHGIEDLGFWAVQGNGRFLGGLPRSTRGPCDAGEGLPSPECGRCGSATNIPIDARLAGVERDRARFVQHIAANWYYLFGAAAETFEQDYLLTGNGLVPDGPARRARHAISLPQAQDRVKDLLRDYFRLAKSQSRPSLAPEFLPCFEQLAALAPDFGQGHYNVGCMHALLGNRQQAVAAVTKAIALDPKYRKVARRDPDLATVRDDPELIRVLGEGGK